MPAQYRYPGAPTTLHAPRPAAPVASSQEAAAFLICGCVSAISFATNNQLIRLAEKDRSNILISHVKFDFAIRCAARFVSVRAHEEPCVEVELGLHSVSEHTFFLRPRSAPSCICCIS